MFFRRSESYDREKCLKSASKAAASGRIKKAISEYMRVLDIDPDDHTIHARLAPLLARRKKFKEAWESFKIAGVAYSSKGFSQKAAGVYTQAAKYMPRQPEVWVALADTYAGMGKKADAVNALYEGHRFFIRKPHTDTAVRLLRKAFTIAPWRFDVTFEMARLLKKTDASEALGLLEGLSERVKGRELVRVRSSMFFMRPGFSMGWLWLKTAWVAKR